MEKDVINELLAYFRSLETSKNWNIDPDEAVQITLASEEEYLFADTTYEYTEMIMNKMEEIAIDRDAPAYSLQKFRSEHLERLIKLSPCAQRNAKNGNGHQQKLSQ